MLIKVYAVILTIAFCVLLLSKTSKQEIVNLPSKTIEKEKTIFINKDQKVSQNELCSYKFNDSYLDFDVKYQLERIKKYVELTPEEEQKITEYSKYSTLSNIFNLPENDSSIEQILGKERHDLVEKRENEYFAKSNIYQTQKKARYLSKVLNLDEEKEELLISLLSSEDLYRESETAYMSKQLNLSPSQENEIYSLYNDYMENYENITKIAKKMSIDVESANFDQYEFGKNLFMQKAKELLDEEQQVKLDKYFEELNNL